MTQTKNLCAQVPLDLHAQVCEAREAAGQTTSEYITQLLVEYYEMKKNGGCTTMAKNNTRTLAFQISEDFFQRIKVHLERETARTGKKLTQREFILGLIEQALDENEGPTRVGPCAADDAPGDTQYQDDPTPAPVTPCEPV